MSTTVTRRGMAHSAPVSPARGDQFFSLGHGHDGAGGRYWNVQYLLGHLGIDGIDFMGQVVGLAHVLG